MLPLAVSAGLGTKPYRALYLLAQALDGIGHRDWAIEKLGQAVEMNPNYKAANELLGTLGTSVRSTGTPPQRTPVFHMILGLKG